MGVGRTPTVGQEPAKSPPEAAGAAEESASSNPQQDLGLLEVLRAQLAQAQPVPALVKSLFEQLSPQSRAIVMSDRGLMPKVVQALSSSAETASDGLDAAETGDAPVAADDSESLGDGWNPLAHPLLKEAADAVTGVVSDVSAALWGEEEAEGDPGPPSPTASTPADAAPADEQVAGSARQLVTRAGTPIYAEPGGKATTLRTSTQVTVIETRIDDGMVKNGNNTEETGKIEWSHVRSTDGALDGWVKFGSVTLEGELSDEMRAAEEIPLDKLKDRTSRAVAQIWNEKGGYIDANRGKLARAVAVAVMKVESGGLGFTSTGEATIRFEVHKLFQNREGLTVTWGMSNPETFDDHFRPRKGAMEHEINVAGASKGGEWSRFHGSQTMEWAALDLATSLADRETALRCISIGAGQVMGFNAPQLGYADATEMFDAMNGDAKANVGGIFGFIRTNPEASAALTAGDYQAFAAEYNGEKYAVDYGRMIAEAVHAFEALEAKYLQSEQA